MAVDKAVVSLPSQAGAGSLATGSGFRHRCASALTHPVTVAALAVLLLNDLAFKAMWPGAWTTGKLSDLAWVVFASPLLAFLLSFPAGQSRGGQRAAFLVAYAGLPLLYAAYNTFAPIHDVILQGLSIASGGTAGSPMDATDSLVIPLGLGIAIWVWRRRVPGAANLRVRGGLLVAGVAALASVASSVPEPDLGVTNVSSTTDGATVAGATSERRTGYRSMDGGLTWQEFTPAEYTSPGDTAQRVDTPRGAYAIQGSAVFELRADGTWKAVYSTRHMATDANRWVQEHATGHLGTRELTTEPRGIAYDPSSGNTIVAMGIQGVVVGTPDGWWNERAVGRYSPVDYSFSGKTSLLLTRRGFWATVGAVALAMVGASLLLSQFRRDDLSWLVPAALASLIVLTAASWVLALTAGGLLLAVFAVVGGALLLSSWRKEGRLDKRTWIPVLVLLAAGALLYSLGYDSLLIVPFLLAGGAIGLGFMPRESRVRRGIGLAAAILSLLAAGALLLTFGRSDVEPSSNTGVLQVLFSVPAYLFGLALLAIAGRELKYWRVVIPTILGMIALIILAFMLWLHLGINLVLAQFSVVVLTALAGLLLAGHIRRKTGPVGFERTL